MTDLLSACNLKPVFRSLDRGKSYAIAFLVLVLFHTLFTKLSLATSRPCGMYWTLFAFSFE